MIIYNKTWLTNRVLIDLVEKEHQQGTISDAELHSIKEKYPVGFYAPNIFIRIGLIIVTVVISFFSERLLNLILHDSGLESDYSWLIAMAILNYIALLIIVKKKFHYRSGVDDALLWMSFWLLIFGFRDALSIGPAYEDMVFASFIFLASLLLTLRFSDRLMSLVSYLSLFYFVYFAWQKIGPWGIATMPFVLMLLSALVYWLVRRGLSHNKTLYYASSIIVLQIISLITLYASGNYYMVKELGDMLNKTTSESIPFGWFFWTWTIILPLGYIYWGLLRKDVISLRVGLILCIVAALTVRNYYHLIPLELVFILSGALVLVISWYLTKYLKTPKHGFTFEDLSNNSLMDQLKIESLIISESSAGIGTAPVNTGTQMGGGKFGGGGASGSF